jgi:hypothetical protein
MYDTKQSTTENHPCTLMWSDINLQFRDGYKCYFSYGAKVGSSFTLPIKSSGYFHCNVEFCVGCSGDILTLCGPMMD